jgi:hypothetical protein
MPSDENICRRTVLSKARDNLVEKVNFLGIYEMINASLAMFKSETGIGRASQHRERATSVWLPHALLAEGLPLVRLDARQAKAVLSARPNNSDRPLVGRDGSCRPVQGGT